MGTSPGPDDPDALRSEWPGVEEAYAFVLPSYQWMVTRLEAADSRIQTLLAFIATVSLAMPTLLGASLDQLAVRWALALGALAIVVGLVSRLLGGVMVVSPDVLWKKWTRRPEWKFKSRMLYYSAQHFRHNKKTGRRKNLAALLMTALFLAEVLLFLLAARP